MTFEEALIKAYRQSPEFKTRVDWLMRWDENKTFDENMLGCPVSPGTVRAWLHRYNLKFVYEPGWRFRQKRKSVKTERLLRLWDTNLTASQLAKKLGVGQFTIMHFRAKHGLVCRRQTKFSDSFVKRVRFNPLRKQALALRKTGLTMEQVGGVLGVTRQRIQQLVD